MSDTIRITVHPNGYLIKGLDGVEEVIEQRETESEARTFQRLVCTLQEMLGAIGSRHDAERFYAEVRPGDKYDSTGQQRGRKRHD